jgi:hypothetical protein
LVYYDGVLGAMSGLVSPFVTGSKNLGLWVGCWHEDILSFRGKIAEMRFWNEQRSVEQLNTYKYAKLNPADHVTLAHYWKLNDNSSTAADSKGTSHGTCYNVTWA